MTPFLPPIDIEAPTPSILDDEVSVARLNDLSGRVADYFAHLAQLGDLPPLPTAEHAA